MKSIKRIGAAALTGILTMSTLAAGSLTVSAEEAGGWDGDVSHVIMTYITSGVDPTDLGMVQDAINERTVPEIGVEVEFKPVSVFDAPSQCPMWIGAGETIDLMCISFTGLQPYIDMNMIEPLDQWLPESAPDLVKMDEAGDPIYDTTSEDAVYGIMTITSPMGNGGGYLIATEALEAAGFDYQNGDKITLDDLDVIFEKVKELYPDSYPAGLLGATPRSGMTCVADPLGATAASGVVMGYDSTEVVNYFATDEYKSFIEHCRSWYEKGYVLKDAATTDVSLTDYMQNGTFLGYFDEGSEYLRASACETYGKEMTRLLINDPHQCAITASANAYWTVPVTAEEPEAALRLLNMLNTDKDLVNLFVWGIEGVHYNFVEGEEDTIVRADNYRNYMALGLYGDQRMDYFLGSNCSEANEEWNATVMENKTKGYGFCYNTSAMTNQITAVQAVITEYQAALETGSADLEKTYPEFLAKLEANGINEIIADKQAQFDAWLAEQ